MGSEGITPGVSLKLIKISSLLNIFVFFIAKINCRFFQKSAINLKCFGRKCELSYIRLATRKFVSCRETNRLSNLRGAKVG